MTITTLTCVVLSCSGCDAALDYDDYSPHFTTIDEARKQAAEYDWWTDGADVDLCEDCKTDSHPFAQASDAEWMCTRCNHEAADHDENAPVVPVKRVIPGQMPLLDGAEKCRHCELPIVPCRSHGEREGWIHEESGFHRCETEERTTAEPVSMDAAEVSK